MQPADGSLSCLLIGTDNTRWVKGVGDSGAEAGEGRGHKNRGRALRDKSRVSSQILPPRASPYPARPNLSSILFQGSRVRQECRWDNQTSLYCLQETNLTTHNPVLLPLVLVTTSTPKSMPFSLDGIFLFRQWTAYTRGHTRVGGTHLPPLNGTPLNCSRGWGTSSSVSPLTELFGPRQVRGAIWPPSWAAECCPSSIGVVPGSMGRSHRDPSSPAHCTCRVPPRAPEKPHSKAHTSKITSGPQEYT